MKGRSLSWYSLIALYPLTVFTMLPVTGVVPILKQLIQDHYRASDLETSLFMSINMVGALIAAPLLGWLSDKYGVTSFILVSCALLDALLWWIFTAQPAFPVLMILRLVEGAAHIGALSMLMAIMSRASAEVGRRARMAAMGGAVIFGVAIGAPLGGILGQVDTLLPLRCGAVLMVIVGLCSALILPRRLRAKVRARVLPRWPRIHVPQALRLPYLFGFVDRLTIGVFIITFSLFTAQLGFGPQRTGLAIGAFMMTFTILSYPAGKLAERVGLWRMVLSGSLCFAIVYALVPWLDGALLWLDMILCGLFSAVMFGPNLMLVVRNSSDETRATAMAGFNAAGSLGFLIGPLLGGGLLQLLKSGGSEMVALRTVFVVVALFEVLCVGFAVAALQHSAETKND